MNTEAVIDTSAIVALYTPEETSDWIRVKVEEYSQFHILDITMYEVDNAIWKKGVLLKELEPHEIEIILKNVQLFIESLCMCHPYGEVRNEAIRMAIKYGITVYDSAYISLALMIRAKFITTDVILAQKVRGTEIEDIIVTP
jgi:predicted nucleic acid-binding protein